MTPLVEHAPAKVNLTLRVRGRRPDGYHDLESLVVFAQIGDRLTLAPDERLELSVEGETAAQAEPPADNLVLKAARALAGKIPDLRSGRFALDKRLPVAAGLGGGSADAAAALRLLARANGLAADDPRLSAAASMTGADVPVCLDCLPRLIRGRGDELSPPLRLPPMPAVLVNPGTPLSTAEVFSAFSATQGRTAAIDDPATALVETADQPAPNELLHALAQSANDLEAAAASLQPAVADALAALRTQEGCLLARMTGSGATCFGLFAHGRAEAAADDIRAQHQGWWVRATLLGDGRLPAA